MAKILVYNNSVNKIETYYRNENDNMPYTYSGYLKVGEFRGSSKSPTIWTTKNAMESFVGQRNLWGGPIPVGYAFKRPWEGGHGKQSQHYAGTAFDVAQGWSNSQRSKLRTSAQNSGLWVYVEPARLTPTWVHFDRRQTPPACSGGGYPVLKLKSISTYVLILQDGLNNLGYSTGGLDGIFGSKTLNSVKQYQQKSGLKADGIVGCVTWRTLQNEAVGRGRSETTVD